MYEQPLPADLLDESSGTKQEKYAKKGYFVNLFILVLIVLMIVYCAMYGVKVRIA